ncbi:MAG: type I DNA topoisomerase [Tepidisphaeraceae bacterium]|jgi:DNA topoisomerase-1
MAKKNAKHLVIVESPAKAKTINKYLGDDYVVRASMGHVRDLPSKGMGVDLKTFVPDYEVLESRSKVIGELKKLAKDSDIVYLATDLDREGEAIAWHLKEALGLPDTRVRRVIFNAITKTEIQKAFKTPHAIDINRVNAQQARRILDRIVGYEISPLLWRKVARGLSAGRVQSVAVRLIVDREREIEKFIPEEYWKIGGVFTANGSTAGKLIQEWTDFLTNTGNGERTKVERDKWLAEHAAFVAEVVEVTGKKFEAGNKADARKVAEALGFVVTSEKSEEDPQGKGPAKFPTKFEGKIGKAPQFVVRGIEKKRVTSRPPGPFITSTLQQAASSRLGFGAQKTMRMAQSLYESGHITYMRTDSTNLSADALTMARSYIQKEFGERYLPEKANSYASSNKSAQEAHEAIRPTDASFTPEDGRGKLGTDESRLYQLIWNRFVACQMAPAEFDATTVQIASGDVILRASGRKLVFDGFMRVAGVSSEDQLLPELAENKPVFPIEISPTQHFTQPPPRFSEATLVKELEKLGIGRPSTYASIISTIQDREYVEQQDRRFYATMLGSIVTDKLIQAFPEIMDVQFTAGMELKLDEIEEKHLDWIKLLKDFYGPFHKTVDGALDKLEHAGGTASIYKCDKCGSPMVYRISKNGFFLSCSNYPECDGIKSVDKQGKPKMQEKSEFKCPKCGREMRKMRGRFGEFLGCSGYMIKKPDGTRECETIINLDKEGKPMPPKPKVLTPVKCEKCGNNMILRDSKRGPFLGCSNFPKCRATKQVAKLTGEDLKIVEQLVPALKEGEAKAAALVAQLTGGVPIAAGNGKTGPIPTDIDCDECGKPMVIRDSRRGKFLGCSGYPKCKNTADVPAKLIEEMGLNGNGNGHAKVAKSAPATDESVDEPVDEAAADEE